MVTGIVVAAIAAGGAVAFILRPDGRSDAAAAPEPSPSSSPSAAPSQVSVPPGCPASAPATPIGLPVSWGFRVDRDGAYVVAVPTDPPVSDGDGPSHRFLVTGGNVTYSVDWYEVGRRWMAADLLDEQVRRTLAGVPDERDVRRRTLDDAPNPTVELRYSSESSHANVIAWLIVAPRRYYQVAMSTTPGYQGFDPERRAFFGSFTAFAGCPVPATPVG